MTEIFNIDRDIPAELWAVIGACAGDPMELRKELGKRTREEMLVLFRGFLEAKTEMADHLVVSGRVTDASEDTLDELADSLVASGKDTYIATYRGTMALPDRAEWHRLPRLTSVFGDVFEERFDADIYDEVEDLE